MRLFRPSSYWILLGTTVCALSWAVPPTIQRCMTCHSGGDPNAPILSLDDYSSLVNNPTLVANIRYRISPSAGRWRMPPDRFLSSEEVAEIERYLATGE